MNFYAASGTFQKKLPFSDKSEKNQKGEKEEISPWPESEGSLPKLRATLCCKVINLNLKSSPALFLRLPKLKSLREKSHNSIQPLELNLEKKILYLKKRLFLRLFILKKKLVKIKNGLIFITILIARNSRCDTL